MLTNYYCTAGCNYFNIISLFNKHDLTNTSLLNIYINKSIYNRGTYIIWIQTTTGHIFVWKWTTIGHILFGHGPLLDKPYYVEHEP